MTVTFQFNVINLFDDLPKCSYPYEIILTAFYYLINAWVIYLFSED